jgi:hypothetical protein
MVDDPSRECVEQQAGAGGLAWVDGSELVDHRLDAIDEAASVSEVELVFVALEFGETRVLVATPLPAELDIGAVQVGAEFVAGVGRSVKQVEPLGEWAG